MQEVKRGSKILFYGFGEQPGAAAENKRKIVTCDVSFPEQEGDGGAEDGGKWCG